MGSPVVSATALARPVAEPPPTQTIASTSWPAAAARARSAASTGTCMTISLYRKAIGISSVMRSAAPAADSPATSMTRCAASRLISMLTAVSAPPVAKVTRWGSVSWVKPMSAPSQHRGQGALERTGRVVRQGLGPPGDVFVRADQQRTRFVDLAELRPVVVEVGDLASRADHDGLDVDAQGRSNIGSGGFPGFARDTGNEGETVIRRKIHESQLIPM